jgi:acyl-CoA dehydrogenase
VSDRAAARAVDLDWELDPDPAAPPFAARHAALRAEVRDWLAEHVTPYVDEWESRREFPSTVFGEAGKAGLLGWKYGADLGGRGPDAIADVVVTEELSRCGSAGVAAGLGATKDLAPYYVARFGSDAQRAAYLVPAVAGQQVAGLAVTETGAGSDVQSIVTRAERTSGGWRMSGAKTFCTNGSRADWLLVAARTRPEPGAHGISLLIVPTGTAGLSTTRIPTLGWRTSQTGAITFDAAELPEDALLGEDGHGFRYIMESFQWERLGMALGALSATAASLRICADALRRSPADPRRGEWSVLVREMLATRALAYAALQDHLAGRTPLRQVSAAKWLACDGSVAAAALRQRLVPDDPRAERALRDARLGPIGGGAREVMAELVARTLPL